MASQGIDVQATPSSKFNVRLVSLTNATTAGLLTNFNKDTSYTWTFITNTAGSVTNFNASSFAIDTSQFSNDLGGGAFVVESGSLNLRFTNNHPPQASTLVVYRQPGSAFRLNFSQLSTNWSDPDGDSTQLVSIDTTSTNGASLFTNSTFIYYENANNVSDRFTYTIRDSRSYRTGDAVRTATGTVLVAMANPSGVTNFNMISLTSLGGNSNELVFAGIPNWTYQVQFATNLTPPVDWYPITTTNASSSGLIRVIDDEATNAVRFYRTVVP